MVNVTGELRKYHQVQYTTSAMLIKAFTRKQKRIQEIKQRQVRIEMIQNVERLCADFDVDGFTSWALSNPTDKKGKLVFQDTEDLNRSLVRVNRFKEGDLYFNPKDASGERFHSVFTNSKKEIRKFIRIGGKMASEVDLKNSQFFFLACLTLHKEASEEILKGFSGLKGYLELLRFYYEQYPDYKSFTDSALNGSLYEYAIQQYASIGKKVSKERMKELLFKAIFSQAGECPQSERILSMVFPSLVKLGNIMNQEPGRLPRLLQVCEARCLLDRVADQAIQLGVVFATVHDSFICKPDDVPLFKHLIKNTFTQLNLPCPQTS